VNHIDQAQPKYVVVYDAVASAADDCRTIESSNLHNQRVVIISVEINALWEGALATLRTDIQPPMSAIL